MKKLTLVFTLVGLVLAACSQIPGHTSAGSNVITLADRGQSILLASGQRFKLDLGDQYRWKVESNDPRVVSRSFFLSLFSGGQGIYRTLQPGTYTMYITGTPKCPLIQTPCPQNLMYDPSNPPQPCPDALACGQPLQITITIVVQ